MTDLLVTFDDGTTELRPENCPVLAGGLPAPWCCHTKWCPTNFTETESVDTRTGPVVFFRLPGERRATRDLACGREGYAMAWCITGQREDGALTGEWRRCYVEAWWEQIARLTRERDAAEKRLADLRSWVGMGAAAGTGTRAWGELLARIDESVSPRGGQ